MIILETERLLLRQFNTDDAPFILTLLNNPNWLQFIGDRNVKTLDDANAYLLNGPLKSYIENGFGLSKIELKEHHIPIGMCGLIKREALENVDIGFALLPAFEGQGFALEIASAMLVYAKNKLEIKKVIAITTIDNIRSIALLNKLGLYFEKMISMPDKDDSLMLFTENIS